MATQSVKIVNILEGLLAGNDQAAARNKDRFSDAGVLAVNIMSSPGGLSRMIRGLPQSR